MRASLCARSHFRKEEGVIVLCSDGFYECSADFVPGMTRVLNHSNLQEALTDLSDDYIGRNRDDATALIMRRMATATAQVRGITDL